MNLEIRAQRGASLKFPVQKVTKREMNMLFLVLAEGAQHAQVFAVLKPNLERIIGFAFAVRSPGAWYVCEHEK